MPINDPTATLHDVLVKSVHNTNEAIRSFAQAFVDAFEPLGGELYPPIAREVVPDLPELVTSWFRLAERLLHEEKELVVGLADLIQPASASSNGRGRRSGSQAAKTPVAA